MLCCYKGMQYQFMGHGLPLRVILNYLSISEITLSIRNRYIDTPHPSIPLFFDGHKKSVNKASPEHHPSILLFFGCRKSLNNASQVPAKDLRGGGHERPGRHYIVTTWPRKKGFEGVLKPSADPASIDTRACCKSYWGMRLNITS